MLEKYSDCSTIKAENKFLYSVFLLQTIINYLY